jgi:hypothetical protein
MALRGASAGRIISYYYGGAQARPATLPATIRVGLLQADHDPAAGGRLGRVLVKGVEVPGKGGSGRSAVSSLTPGGRKARRSLGGHTTWSIRPESGGTSVFDPSGRRVFGPTRAGTGVVVRFQTALRPARLSLPQTGQQLALGPPGRPPGPRQPGRHPPPGGGRDPPSTAPSTDRPRPALRRLRQGAGLLRGALGRGRSRHRVAGRALRLPGRAGLLLLVRGRLHLQQRPVGERPPALVPEPLRRPLRPGRGHPPEPELPLVQDGVGGLPWRPLWHRHRDPGPRDQAALLGAAGSPGSPSTGSRAAGAPASP